MKITTIEFLRGVFESLSLRNLEECDENSLLSDSFLEYGQRTFAQIIEHMLYREYGVDEVITPYQYEKWKTVDDVVAYCHSILTNFEYEMIKEDVKNLYRSWEFDPVGNTFPVNIEEIFKNVLLRKIGLQIVKTSDDITLTDGIWKKWKTVGDIVKDIDFGDEYEESSY